MWALKLSFVAIVVFTVLTTVCTAKRRFAGASYRRNYHGTRMEIQNFPWIVHLYSTPNPYDRNLFSFCGGSILSQYFVLTAAHCFNSADSVEIIKYGVNTYDINTGTSVGIIKAVVHNRHSNPSIEIYDIAVAEAEYPGIQFSEYAKPIALRLTPGTANEMATVCGWGKYEWGSHSEYLLSSNIRVLSYDVCRQKTNYNPYITEVLICTSTNPCFGDSGGPLMVGNSQIGIVSGATPGAVCADANLPMVFTNVPYFKDFIDQYSQNTADWVY